MLRLVVQAITAVTALVQVAGKGRTGLILGAAAMVLTALALAIMAVQGGSVKWTPCLEGCKEEEQAQDQVQEMEQEKEEDLGVRIHKAMMEAQKRQSRILSLEV